MSMLQTIMSSVMQNAMRRPSTASTEEDRLAKENRAALRKLYENAGPEERKALLPTMQRSGIDTDPYRIMEGIETPQEQTDRLLQDEFLRVLTGQQPSSPAQTPEIPTGATGTPEQPAQQPQVRPEIFTHDFLTRAAIKKYSGIDVGAHYFEAPAWFESYGKRVDSGVPVEQAISDTAVEYGFIPDGASNLEGISLEDRTVLFEREFSSAFSDPELDNAIRKLVPEGTNVNKAKAGLILDSFAQRGRFIPDHYQQFLDRFRGLEDPSFVSDDIKEYIYQNTGKTPADIEPSDVADAREAIRNDHFLQVQQDAYLNKLGTTQAEWELEMQKPISAEDRGKYGIGSEVKTYRQLADEGKRFATEADRKMYQELYTARSRLIGMRNLFFGTTEHPEWGIFTGIKNAAPARASAKARLTWEKLNGTDRGRNAEEFADYKAYFARTLIKIAGESGSRLSDQDIIGIITTMPDMGIGLLGMPDSEALARSKFDRAVTDMGRLMKQLEETTTMGKESGGAPASKDIDARIDALIEKYIPKGE